MCSWCQQRHEHTHNTASSGIKNFVAPGTCGIPGDLNGDGFVNAVDLSILLGAWGLGGVADINGDGIVDAADMATLLGNFS